MDIDTFRENCIDILFFTQWSDAGQEHRKAKSLYLKIYIIL